MVAKIQAKDNADAARKVVTVLPPEHYDKPISLKRDEPLPPPPTDKGN